MGQRKISRGMRKRIRVEKARLRREERDPERYHERFAETLQALGIPAGTTKR